MHSVQTSQEHFTTIVYAIFFVRGKQSALWGIGKWRIIFVNVSSLFECSEAKLLCFLQSFDGYAESLELRTEPLTSRRARITTGRGEGSVVLKFAT